MIALQLDAAGRNKFWADRKAACEAKQGVAHAAVAAVAPTTAPAPAPSVSSLPGSITNTSVDYERFQRYLALLEATKDLNVGFT